MMKVLCINAQPIPGNDPDKGILKKIREGKTYEVTEICRQGYFLRHSRRRQWKLRLAYSHERFLVLGGPDERDILEERMEEEAKRLDAIYAEIPGIEDAFVPFEPSAYARVWNRVLALFKSASL